MPMDKQLAIKLAKAAVKIQNPTKNATNPFLKNRYADLGNVIDVTKQVLLDLNVFVMQSCTQMEGQNGPYLDVTTTFIDGDTGATAAINVSVHLKELSPQGSMGAFTYGRRYGLNAAFNLAAEDDDGNTASGKADKDNDPIMDKVPVKTAEQAGKGIAALLAAKKEQK